MVSVAVLQKMRCLDLDYPCMSYIHKHHSDTFLVLFQLRFNSNELLFFTPAYGLLNMTGIQNQHVRHAAASP